MPLSASRIRNNEKLSKDGLNADDIKDFRRTQEKYFKDLADMEDAELKGNYEVSLSLEYQLSRTAFRLKYQGVNPKEIPLAELKEHVTSYEHDDRIIQTYRRKALNAASAVRAFCMTCMGGQQVEIRRCQATSCPLWPVRMGKNPFFGKAMPPVTEIIELEDDADATLVEDDDNAEAKD